jgi:hypothetical protein
VSPPPRGPLPPHLPSIHPGPQFPNYIPVPQPSIMERKQTSHLFKLANKMLKLPKTKVLQRRNRVSKRKFKII